MIARPSSTPATEVWSAKENANAATTTGATGMAPATSHNSWRRDSPVDRRHARTSRYTDSNRHTPRE